MSNQPLTKSYTKGQESFVAEPVLPGPTHSPLPPKTAGGQGKIASSTQVADPKPKPHVVIAGSLAAAADPIVDPPIPGGENVAGYRPVGAASDRTEAKRLENTPVQYPTRPVDIGFAGSNEAVEYSTMVTLCGMIPPQDPDALSPFGQQERWRPSGKGIKALGSIFHALGSAIEDRSLGKGGFVRHIRRGRESGDLDALTDDAGVTEVVIGRDDRTLIADTTSDPWSGILSLSIVAGNGLSYVGTGWLIGPRVAITAGHCVYGHDSGGWAREIRVSAGRNGDQTPFGTQLSVNFRAPSAWTEQAVREQDFGVIFLDQPLIGPNGASPMVFDFAAMSDADLRGSMLNLAGYPADKLLEGKDGTRMFYHARVATDLSPEVVYYDIDTAGGHSGAPVWLTNSESWTRVVPCLHTNGHPMGNSATRITPEIEAIMEGWRADGL